VTANQLVVLATVALCACAWIAFAEHPDARNLRRAIGDTLPFL
jgi:hypothetical protein